MVFIEQLAAQGDIVQLSNQNWNVPLFVLALALPSVKLIFKKKKKKSAYLSLLEIDMLKLSIAKSDFLGLHILT